jgi:uncharacterized membrane protein YagU involved in acid resistance
MIPKDLVERVIRDGGEMDIAGISSGMVQSGYKMEGTPPIAPDMEKINPFIKSLTETLDEMCADGTIIKNADNGKTMYTIKK